MAKVRKKYDITAREGVKFCAVAIFFCCRRLCSGGWRLFVAFVCDACLWGGLWGLLVALLVALLVWRCLWGLLVGRVMGGGRLPLPVASLFGAEKLQFGCGNLGLRAVF